MNMFKAQHWTLYCHWLKTAEISEIVKLLVMGNRNNETKYFRLHLSYKVS